MAAVQEVTKHKHIYLANSMNSLSIEGQKTIAIEIVQQFDWEVPDWIVLPGGNLGNVSAIGKGFMMMHDLGLISKLPRICVAQAEHANPFYQSYLDKLRDLRIHDCAHYFGQRNSDRQPGQYPESDRDAEAI